MRTGAVSLRARSTAMSMHSRAPAPKPHPELSARLDELQAVYNQGRFAELLPQVQRWLANSPEADRAARFRAGVLQLRCLAKLEQWEALARESNALLA